MRIDFTKPPLLFEEQISLLSSRGLIIGDKEEAIKTLKIINYYRLKARIKKKDKKYFAENQNNTYFAALFAMKYLAPSSQSWNQFIHDLAALILQYQDFIDFSLLDLRDSWQSIMLDTPIESSNHFIALSGGN